MRAWIVVPCLLSIGCGNAVDAPRTPASTDGSAPGPDLPAPDLGVPADLSGGDIARWPRGDVDATVLADLAVTASDLSVAPRDLAAGVDLAQPAQDLARPADLSQPAQPDLAQPPPPDLAQPPGDGFVPPGASDPWVVHAPAQPLAGVTTLFSGLDVLDVSVDQGGGVWAVTASAVYYLPPGRTTPFSYTQANGLARGWTQWTDTWFSPGTYPVTFASVAGVTAGVAVIGNIGAIADRLVVNPTTGAVISVENLKITAAQVADPVYRAEHEKRVVAVLKAVVDLNGTFSGTAYLGGFHGFYAFHGMAANCGCLAFEEHQHYVDSDTLGGADVRGLALSPLGDVWAGDRDMVQRLPQRSQGASTGLFDTAFNAAVDVFPGRRDEITALAVDGSDGVYVAADGNGLAYLAPATLAPRYWSSATTLPQNRLRGLAFDRTGALWIGTHSAGVARYTPSTGAWSYHSQATGLPANEIKAIYRDTLSGGGKLYIATYYGVAVVP